VNRESAGDSFIAVVKDLSRPNRNDEELEQDWGVVISPQRDY
jgi:hypothetical protein